jgi:hypothetical protein
VKSVIGSQIMAWDIDPSTSPINRADLSGIRDELGVLRRTPICRNRQLHCVRIRWIIFEGVESWKDARRASKIDWSLHVL